MKTTIITTIIFGLCLSIMSHAQTFMTIDSMRVTPSKLVENDSAYIKIVGYKSTPAVVILSATATISGFNVNVDMTLLIGLGLPVIVQWDTLLYAGILQAGKYTIIFNGLYIQDNSNPADKQFTVLPLTTIEKTVFRSTYLSQPKPNPVLAQSTITYQTSSAPAIITIHDMTGRNVMSIELSSQTSGVITISNNEMEPGVYFYSLYNNGTLRYTRKLVIF